MRKNICRFLREKDAVIQYNRKKINNFFCWLGGGAYSLSNSGGKLSLEFSVKNNNKTSFSPYKNEKKNGGVNINYLKYR